MPRGDNWLTEREAMEIVRREELAQGWRPEPLSKSGERREGCDFLSYPPDGGEPDRVEVKGRGDRSPFAGDGFGYGIEINAEQLRRAQNDPRWRLEIVANLTAARAGIGTPERLSLTAAEVVKRAQPKLYRLDLEGLQDRVRPVSPWAATEPRVTAEPGGP